MVPNPPLWLGSTEVCVDLDTEAISNIFVQQQLVPENQLCSMPFWTVSAINLTECISLSSSRDRCCDTDQWHERFATPPHWPMSYVDQNATACTSVVTSVSYHCEETLKAEISFMQLEQWKEELRVLLQDLHKDDGTSKRTSDLTSEGRVALQKVKSNPKPLSPLIDSHCSRSKQYIPWLRLINYCHTRWMISWIWTKVFSMFNLVTKTLPEMQRLRRSLVPR